jgi:Domain of unknown function (DUF4136)
VKFTKAIIFPAAAKFGPALVLVLVACSVTSAQDVRTNYMPRTDFSKYHTYTWVNDVQGVPAVGGHPDQILDAQVKEAIDSQMVAKGFTNAVDGKKADLLLGYQLAIDQEKNEKEFGRFAHPLHPEGFAKQAQGLQLAASTSRPDLFGNAPLLAEGNAALDPSARRGNVADASDPSRSIVIASQCVGQDR